MPRRAFTLFQAILILALLLLLAAILFPIFARKREPRRSTCQSNLNQIGRGFIQYLQDFDELFPRFNVGNVGSTTYGSFTVTHWVQALQPYTKTTMIFQCPEELNSLGTDYYYNRVASGLNEIKFNNSANTVLLTEGTDTPVCWQATATAPVTSGDPPAYSRHLQGSNYAFVDGHVKWLQSTRAASPSNVPARRGGFTFGS